MHLKWALIFFPPSQLNNRQNYNSRLELTYIEKCILPYKSFCLGSKTFKVKKQTNKKNRVRPFDSFSHHTCILMTPVVQTLDSTIHQAPVFQKVDNAIHRIAQLVFLIFMHLIVIYPVDSAIQLLNNWGQGPVSRTSR